LSKEGTKFPSYKTAADFMKTSGGYTQDQIDRIYLYPDGKNHYQNHDENWKTNEYLPEGWKCKEGSGKVCIQTNTGVKLQSYRAASTVGQKEGGWVQFRFEGLTHHMS